MKKMTLVRALILTTISTNVLANGLYVGPSLFFQNVSASHSSARDLHPRLSLGYGDMSGEYYLSGEIFAVPFSSALSNSTDQGYQNAKISRSYGASFIPGIMLNDSILGYLRLGLVYSKFSGPNVSKTGGQIGAGISTPITSNWNFRAEYIYSGYRSASGLGSPHSNELGIGAIYNFDGT